MTGHAEVANFHVLRERLRLQGIIETKTALRIGSGGGGNLDASELPVLRDADGYPLIPGSSLKGVVRSTVEALVRGAGTPRSESGVWSCDPLSDDLNNGDPTCGRHSSGKGARAKAHQQQHCSVCSLFGSRVIASHVRFSDAMLRDAESMKRAGRIPVEVRDGVAIDRDLRTAQGGQKYDFEVIAPGTLFELEVFVENPEDWLMGLLIMGFDQVAEGFTAIGGFTSRGLGRVALKWSSLSRYEARALLEGQGPKTLDASGMHAEFERWRGALAARSKGGR